MLAPQHPDVMKNVQMLIPERLCTSVELKWLNDELLEEVNNDYELSLRKAIGKAKTRKIYSMTIEMLLSNLFVGTSLFF